MKKKVTVLLFALGIIANIFGQSSVFKYDESKMEAGTMYDYSIKELNGSKEMSFQFYIKDPETIICYVDFSNIFSQVQIFEEKYNTEVCAFAGSKGIVPFEYLKLPKSNGSSEDHWDYENLKLDATAHMYDLSGKKKVYSVHKNIPMAPTYEMSLYQLDLWFAMRFINPDVKKFKVGSMYGLSSSEAEVSYVGEETINGKLCDKWVVEQLGIIAKAKKEKQTIWFDKNDKYYNVVKYTNTKSISPIGKLDINLRNKKQISFEEWNEFVNKRNEEVRVKYNLPKDENND